MLLCPKTGIPSPTRGPTSQFPASIHRWLVVRCVTRWCRFHYHLREAPPSVWPLTVPRSCDQQFRRIDRPNTCRQILRYTCERSSSKLPSPRFPHDRQPLRYQHRHRPLDSKVLSFSPCDFLGMFFLFFYFGIL